MLIKGGLGNHQDHHQTKWQRFGKIVAGEYFPSESDVVIGISSGIRYMCCTPALVKWSGVVFMIYTNNASSLEQIDRFADNIF